MPRLFSLLLTLLAAISVQAREFYVNQQHPQSGDTAAGTREAPLKTISAAARMAQAGDTVVVAAGIYRESVTLTNSGSAGKPIVFRSEEPRKAVLCGSDVLTQWAAAGPGVWVTTVPVIRKNESALPHSSRGGEWVFVNGSPLLYSEPGQTQMPGTFRLDHAAGKLFVAPEEGVSLTGVTVEYAQREGLFWPDKPLDDIHLIGFTLRHNAIWFRGKHAILMQGRRWRVEDNHILWSTYSGLGMKHTSQCVVRGNLIEWCGEGGMVGGWNSGLTIENNRVQYCNWRRNDPSSMGVGGSKWAFTFDSVVRGNHFAFNQGSGIWFDWGNCNNVIEHNVSHDNSAWGLFSECNWDENFFDNVTYNNAYGLVIAESPGSVGRRNVVFNNDIGGFMRGVFNRSNGAGYTADAEKKMREGLQRIPDLSPSATERIMSGWLKYHGAVPAFMSNNSVLWENLLFDNETTLWEGRDYGTPGPKDPFINNLSDYNLFSVPPKCEARGAPALMRHPAGEYPALADWQKVSRRDAHSQSIDIRTAKNLPAWAESKRPLWDLPMQRRAEVHTLGLVDGPVACIAHGRVFRSAKKEPLALTDPQVKAVFLDVDGEKTLMLWTSHPMARRYVRLALEQDEISIEDAYLRSTKTALPGRTLDLVVTWLPVYLKGITGTVRQTPAATLQVNPFNPPDAPVRLTASLPNDTSTEQPLTAAFSVSPGFTVKATSIPATIAAHTTTEIHAKLIPDGSVRRGSANVRLLATVGSQSISRITLFSIGESGGTLPAHHGDLQIDGQLDDWPDIKAGKPPLALIGDADQFVVGKREAWQGRDDLSGKVYASWTADALHLAVIVTDDRVLGLPTPANAWNGDCAEIFIDGRSGDMLWQTPPTEGCYHIAIAPGPDATKPNLTTWAAGAPGQLRGLAVASSTTSTGYTVEMKIPLTLKNFPDGDWQPGRPLKLSVLLYDRDEPKTPHADYTLGWSFSPEGANFKDTTGWKTLILAK